MPRTLRWMQTLWPLAPAQLGWRAFYRLEARLGRATPPRLPPATTQLPLTLFAAHYRGTAETDRECTDRLQNGHIQLLNQTERIREEDGTWLWDFPFQRCSRLWQFQLHSFGFAAPLARAGASELLRETILSWIEANPPGARGASWLSWNSYTIANRLENWAYAETVLNAPLPPIARASAARQAAHLASHMERDLRGNHLIRNACALLFAGTWLQDRCAGFWRRRARRILAGCVRRQILIDGGHYERSPMYHLLVMEDLAEALALLRLSGEDAVLAEALARALRRMAIFAATMRCGDGEIPLFNDSVFGMAPPPAAVLMRTQSLLGGPIDFDTPGSLHFGETGYCALRAGPWRAIVDGGPLGPDEQPAHAHCDLGSLCVSLGTERLIEDTGVFEYQRGERRAYVRSTAAHSVLQIEGVEQGDCWGEFRLGWRVHPESLVMTSPHSCRVRFRWPRLGVVQQRDVEITPTGLTTHDRIDGQGQVPLALRWHFAPGWEPASTGDLGQWRSRTGTRVTFGLPTTCAWSLHRTPYYPELGEARERYCLTGTVETSLPLQLSTTITQIPSL